MSESTVAPGRYLVSLFTWPVEGGLREDWCRYPDRGLEHGFTVVALDAKGRFPSRVLLMRPGRMTVISCGEVTLSGKTMLFYEELGGDTRLFYELENSGMGFYGKVFREPRNQDRLVAFAEAAVVPEAKTLKNRPGLFLDVLEACAHVEEADR